LLNRNASTAFVSNKEKKLMGHNFRREEQVMMSTISSISYDSLIKDNLSTIDELKSIAPKMSDTSRLRFALAYSTRIEARRALREAMNYRNGDGKSIMNAAARAVVKATAEGGWDNDVVRDMAPHASKINQFITPKNILTISTEDGDLVYIIRASLIDDRKLMSTVSVKEMTDFFLYVKEVHNLVANARSEKTGRLCNVIFANDISGVRAIPDRKFSQALTESSQQYEKLYPSLAGPTMILNLPSILQAFIGLIKPLFPKSVQERLVFKKAPVLKSLSELTPLTTNSNTRKSFLSEIKNLLSK